MILAEIFVNVRSHAHVRFAIACRRVRIHPHKQSRAVSRVSCVHAQTQPVPLLLSNDVDRSSMCCQPSTTAQLVGYCICGVMRTYTGAAGLVVPHNGPVRLACHRVRTHPSEKPCASSVGTRSHSEAPCAAAPPVKRRRRTLLALAARWRKWFACGNSHASSSCLAHEPNPRPARDQHASSTRTTLRATSWILSSITQLPARCGY